MTKVAPARLVISISRLSPHNYSYLCRLLVLVGVVRTADTGLLRAPLAACTSVRCTRLAQAST